MGPLRGRQSPLHSPPGGRRKEGHAVVSNQEIIDTIKVKLEEKNEVIREQQETISELQSKVGDLESKLDELQTLEKERTALIQEISELD
jgi:uncharacterized coiled-coil protein SlyX